jgi:hypothetical protein
VELNERMRNTLGTVRSNRKKKPESLKKRLKKEEADRRSSYGLIAANVVITKMFMCSHQKMVLCKV